MARERMTGVDTAWLRMDSPANLMMITAVQIFDARISYAALARVLRERLLVWDRFRQRVVADATGYSWVEDGTFDLADHLVRERLPGNAGDAELKALVGRLASQPLDPDRPLWEFRLIENYRDAAGGRASACVIRIHHCIADGIALVGVTLSLADDWADPSRPVAGAAGRPLTRREDAPAGHAEESRDWLFGPLTWGTVKAWELYAQALKLTLDAGAKPNRVPDVARAGLRVVADGLRIALMTQDSPTSLKGTPKGRKAVAWIDPMPLADVKAVCKVLDVSLNDVLLSCVAGSLHRHLRSRGEDTRGVEIRAMVPINLRPADEPPSLGNRFGLVPLVLPVGIANPIERLFEVRRRMNDLKGGYQGMLSFALLSAMGYVPRVVQTLLLDYLGNKGSAVMTNVPGPIAPIGVAGARLRQVIPWVPQSGSIGVGISIFSYDGKVQFGMIADTAIVEDPQRVVDGFVPEFERLVLALSLLPRKLVSEGRLDPDEAERWLFSGDGTPFPSRAGSAPRRPKDRTRRPASARSRRPSPRA